MTDVLGIFFKPKEFSLEDTINVFIKNQILQDKSLELIEFMFRTF